jgi:hypothetical protein
VAQKRLKVTGFIEVPDGADLPGLGFTVDFKGTGEITGEGTQLTRKANGDTTIVETNVITVDTKHSSIGHITEPQGPLDEALAEAGAAAE